MREWQEQFWRLRDILKGIGNCKAGENLEEEKRMKPTHIILQKPESVSRTADQSRHIPLIFPILLTALIFFGFDPGVIAKGDSPVAISSDRHTSFAMTDQGICGKPGVIPCSDPYDEYYYPWLERPSPRIDMTPDSLPPNVGTDDLTMLFHKVGADTMSLFGFYLCLAGDQNEDGYDDVLVSSSHPDQIHLYHGGPTGQMDTIPDWVIDIEPSTGIFTGGNGKFPTELADLNGDGDTDIAFWRVEANLNKQVYVYFGGAMLDDEVDLILGCEIPNSQFGNEISCGDINGDGYKDLAVSATSYNTLGPVGAGKIFIYFGGTDFDSIPDFTIASQYNNFGNGFFWGGL